MRYFVIIFLFLCPMVAHGQGSVRRVESLSDLLRVNPIATSTGDKLSYEVINRATNVTWAAPRHAVWRAQSALSTNNWSVFSSPFGGQWVFDDRESTVIDVRWMGMVGDGLTDNKAQFAEMIATAATNAVKFTFPAGTFNVSTNLLFQSNYPINIDTTSGYSTGWNPDDAATSASIVYTGPSTPVFVDFTPAVGIRYGLNIRGITFDANTYADTAVKIKLNSRGNVDQMRARNGIERVAVLELSQYINFDNVTVSSAEVPFLISNKVGLALTNQANLNNFRGLIVNGATEFGIDISANSKANVLITTGSEGNSGGALRFRETANQNTVLGLWMEQNLLTNRIIQVDQGSIGNRIVNAYSENREGTVYVDGAYTLISESAFGGLEFGVNGGHNVVQDVILGIGVLPSGPIHNQTLINVIDATADLRTNSFPDSISFYGPALNLINGTNQFPMARITRSSIMFGDGLTDFPDAGWERISALTLKTDKTLLSMRPGANDTLWNGYRAGNAYASIALGLPGQILMGDGSSPPDVTISRYIPHTLLIDSGILTIRDSTNDTFISSYPSGSSYPMLKISMNGSHEWGMGGSSPTDTKLYRYGPGVLRIDSSLYIGSTNVLDYIGGRSSTNHNHDGSYVLSTNGFSTNLTATGETTLTGTIIATNIGADLASAGAHRIIVREATTMGLRPMTPAYLLGLLDVHAANIVDATTIGRNILKASSLPTLMGEIGAGTPNSNVWLRGDAVWSTPPVSAAATNGIPDAPSDDVMYARINAGWASITPYFIDMPLWDKNFLTANDSDEALFSLNLTTETPTTINSPAVHVTRVNSGGTESARHRLNLISGTGISLSISDDSVDDEADVTVSSTIADSSVTLSKIESVGAGRLLGRGTASSGAPQEIAIGTGLSMSGTNLSVDTSLFNSGQILYVSADEVSLGGASFTQQAWTNILGTPKSGTSKTISVGALSSGTTLKIELSGTMAFQNNTVSNKVRVSIGGLVITFPFAEIDSSTSRSGVWDMTCMLTVKASGSHAVTKATGWWNWQTLDNAPEGPTSSWYGYRTRAFVTGELDTTGSNLISADFYGDNVSGTGQFTEFDCNHVIVTRY